MKRKTKDHMTIMLVIVVIILSLANIGVKHTGKATTSVVNLTVNPNIQIKN